MTIIDRIIIYFFAKLWLLIRNRLDAYHIRLDAKDDAYNMTAIYIRKPLNLKKAEIKKGTPWDYEATININGVNVAYNFDEKDLKGGEHEEIALRLQAD